MSGCVWIQMMARWRGDEPKRIVLAAVRTLLQVWYQWHCKQHTHTHTLRASSRCIYVCRYMCVWRGQHFELQTVCMYTRRNCNKSHVFDLLTRFHFNNIKTQKQEQYNTSTKLVEWYIQILQQEYIFNRVRTSGVRLVTRCHT